MYTYNCRTTHPQDEYWATDRTSYEWRHDQRILRDFHHGFTVSGNQQDRSFDMHLQVDTWRCRPVVLRVRARVQWNNTPTTQCNLVCAGLSCPHSDEGRKALTLSLLFLVVIQERWLRTHSWWHIHELCCVPIKNTRSHRQDHCFWFLTLYVELHFPRSSPLQIPISKRLERFF